MEKYGLFLRELACGVAPGLTNTYFLVNGQTREALVIDPAGEMEKIRETVRDTEARPVAVLLTHTHYDHVLALRAVQEEYGIPVYYAGEDKAMLTFFLQMFGGDGAAKTKEDVTVSDGEALTLAGFRLQVMATPGHSAGSVCYYLPEEELLFSGDTLFQGSVGRTDFPLEGMQGSLSDLARSIAGLMQTLPDSTRVLPGHGPETSIGEERKHNPFVARFIDARGGEA